MGKNLIESTVEETKAVLEEPLRETEAALKEAQGKDGSNSDKGEDASDVKYANWLPKD